MRAICSGRNKIAPQSIKLEGFWDRSFQWDDIFGQTPGESKFSILRTRELDSARIVM